MSTARFCVFARQTAGSEPLTHMQMFFFFGRVNWFFYLFIFYKNSKLRLRFKQCPLRQLQTFLLLVCAVSVHWKPHQRSPSICPVTITVFAGNIVNKSQRTCQQWQSKGNCACCFCSEAGTKEKLNVLSSVSAQKTLFHGFDACRRRRGGWNVCVLIWTELFHFSKQVGCYLFKMQQRSFHLTTHQNDRRAFKSLNCHAWKHLKVQWNPEVARHNGKYCDGRWYVTK